MSDDREPIDVTPPWEIALYVVGAIASFIASALSPYWVLP